jgi:putative transposase
MRKKTSAQIDLFPKRSKSYGGILLTKRKNRAYARPISTKQTMHLVLRSSLAIDAKSFRAPQNEKAIQKIIEKFSLKYGIRILSLANVGTHLHFHMKIARRAGYLCFIRAVTAAIAMHVTGKNRWTAKTSKQKFWDYRPFTRIVNGFRALLNLQDYIQINQLEGLGVPRQQARFILANSRPRLC